MKGQIMNQSTVNLVLHPIRMRILMALAGHERTVGQLGELLADVPQATLYRHIKLLADSGILIVVSENPVRGTVEKVYTLDANHASLRPDELDQLDADSHMRLFVGFIASLLDDYARYLAGSQTIDLVADGVGYRKVILNLSQSELVEMSQTLNLALKPYLALPTAPERQARLFSTVLMPDLPAQENDDEQDEG
jgi:DNA-binding transcriptional ArsR family regulator